MSERVSKQWPVWPVLFRFCLFVKRTATGYRVPYGSPSPGTVQINESRNRTCFSRERVPHTALDGAVRVHATTLRYALRCECLCGQWGGRPNSITNHGHVVHWCSPNRNIEWPCALTTVRSVRRLCTAARYYSTRSAVWAVGRPAQLRPNSITNHGAPLMAACTVRSISRGSSDVRK